MTAATDNRAKGILWMLVTMMCFTGLDTTMKYTLGFYPLMEANWGRFFFATVFAALVAGRRLPQIAKSRLPQWQFVRSFMLGVTTVIFNAAIRGVPLPTGTTIMFLTPIIVTLLSSLLLAEQVGWRRWSSIGVGFLGAVVVAASNEYSGSTNRWSVILLLIAAFTNASYHTVTRRLRGDNPLTTLLYGTALGAIITTVLLPFSDWIWPTPAGWGLLMLAGGFGCLGHLFLIRAYNNAPASVVAPFSYSQLIWSTTTGFLIWGDFPNLATICGAGLIVASGFYIFLRETKLAREKTPEAEPA